MANYGKAFEQSFRENWKKCFPKPEGWIYRLPDQMNGFKQTSRNISDFICFVPNKLFIVECKETNGNTLNFSKIRQLDQLEEAIGYKKVYPGVLVWFSDHDKIFWVNAIDLKRMQADGKKSINIKMYDEENKYHLLDMEGKLKRVFLECDYHKLLSMEVK